MTKKELELEWLKCAMDFEYFAETYLTTEDKRIAKQVPFKLMPHQKELIKIYSKDSHTIENINSTENTHFICNKYRQSGITTLICAYYTWKICFNQNIKLGVIGNNLEHARIELLKKISDNINNLPSFLRVETIIDSQKYKTYANGSEIIAKAGQGGSLRGTGINNLIIDEFAHFEHAEEFWESSKSVFSMGGNVCIISTPNGSNNVFYKIFDLALQGKSTFKCKELKWYHDVRLNTDLKWVSGNDEIIEFDVEKQKELILRGYKPTSTWYENECSGFNFDKKKIAQELDCQFIGSGSSYVDEEYLNKQEVENVTKPNFYIGKDKNFWVWKYPETYDQKFIFGIDVASGVAEDYSTISVINMLTKEMYAEYRGKIAPEDFADTIFEFTKIYNEPYICIDLTGGYGVPVAQKLINIYEYKNMHYTEIKDRYIKDRLENEGNNDLRPGIIIGKNRLEILDAMSRGFRRDEIIVRSSRLIEELKGFKDVNGRPDHKRGGTSDCIFALAIALYICDTNGTSISKALEKTKAMVSAWVVSNNNEEYYERELKSRYENNSQETNINKKIIPDIFFLF